MSDDTQSGLLALAQMFACANMDFSVRFGEWKLPQVLSIQVASTTVLFWFDDEDRLVKVECKD